MVALTHILTAQLLAKLHCGGQWCPVVVAGGQWPVVASGQWWPVVANAWPVVAGGGGGPSDRAEGQLLSAW